MGKRLTTSSQLRYIIFVFGDAGSGRVIFYGESISERSRRLHYSQTSFPFIIMTLLSNYSFSRFSGRKGSRVWPELRE